MSTPDPLHLADLLEAGDTYDCGPLVVYGWPVRASYNPTDDSAAELRRQHAEIERLTAERDAIRALLPDELFAGSKDWSQGNTAQRVECLKTWLVHAQAEARVAYLAFEQVTAEREGHCSGASDAYFKARPTHDNDAGRMLFERGYVRGFDKATELAEARAALAQGKEPSNPKGLARSDADYWIRGRTAILQAIADRGLMLVSNKDGFCLMEAGNTQAQPREPSNG